MYRIILCLAFFAATPAVAGQPEARALALANGCKPVKIEVLRQTFGSSAATTYSVTCENKAPAAQGSTEKKMAVRCTGSLCVIY